MCDVVERGLRTATCLRILASGVQAVFQYIQIEGTQVFGTENLQFADNRVELVLHVVRFALALQLAQQCECVLVYFGQFFGGNGFCGKVEIGNIGQ